MYTVSKGPSKIVAKTRRGLTQNYEKFETIKESGKRSEKNSPENLQTPKSTPPVKTITTQNIEKIIPTQIYCEDNPNSLSFDENYHNSNYMAKTIIAQIICGRISQLKNTAKTITAQNIKRAVILFVGEDVPRPVFQTIKKTTVHTKQTEEEVITPQHEEIIKYINDSWNIIVAHNPYDTNGVADTNINSVSSSMKSSASSSVTSSACTSPAATPPPQSASIYCVEPPSPVLSDFKPFDLESWWGRRLFNNITKSL